MDTKEIKLKFNLKDWLDILPSISLKETDPNQDFSPSYKKEVIARNEEKKIYQQFLSDLKKKKEDNKEAIKKAYISSKPFPFPELIPAPTTKHGFIERLLMRVVEDIKNKECYFILLRNNNIPCYYELVDRMSSERRRDNVVFHYSVHNGEDYYFNIFKHAILMCPPSQIQNSFEWWKSQYQELDKIDSKKEAQDKLEELRYDIHKSMRNADPLGNPHSEMIIHSLMNLSDLPHRAIKAVIDHVNKLETEKV